MVLYTSRRSIFKAVGITLLSAIAGCSSRPLTGRERKTTACDTVEARSHSESPITIHNRKNESRELTIVIHQNRKKGREVILDTSLTLSGGGKAWLTPDLKEKTNYTIEASTSSRTTSRTVFYRSNKWADVVIDSNLSIDVWHTDPASHDTPMKQCGELARGNTETYQQTS